MSRVLLQTRCTVGGIHSKSVYGINQDLHWTLITQLQLKLLILRSRQCFHLSVQLSDSAAVDLSAHLKITGFFPFIFRSIISFKWEPGLWQTCYGGGLIQPKRLLRSGWIVRESSFIQSQQQNLYDSKWSPFELSAFSFCSWFSFNNYLKFWEQYSKDLSLCVQNWLYRYLF